MVESKQTGQPGARRWPGASQYHEAIQNPRLAFGDAELREGTPLRNPLGMPAPFAGAFADVYQIVCPSGDTWAVKCFKREVHDLRDRYRLISESLRQSRLPFMVDFQYLDEGVRIEHQAYPIVKMRWVEGLALNEFVEGSLGDPGMLDQLLRLWIRVAARLRAAGIAHGDLQHGNVLLVPHGDHGQLALRLIDYDGMYVPSLAGCGSREFGHPNYQHPARDSSSHGPELDRFSNLAICAAIGCLRFGGRRLWERYDNGENLLFRESDYRDPAASPLFRELWALRDPECRGLVGRLALATRRPLVTTPLVEELIVDGRVRPLNEPERLDLERLLGTPVHAPLAPSPPVAAPPAPITIAPHGLAPLAPLPPIPKLIAPPSQSALSSPGLVPLPPLGPWPNLPPPAASARPPSLEPTQRVERHQSAGAQLLRGALVSGLMVVALALLLVLVVWVGGGDASTEWDGLMRSAQRAREAELAARARFSGNSTPPPDFVEGQRLLVEASRAMGDERLGDAARLLEEAGGRFARAGSGSP